MNNAVKKSSSYISRFTTSSLIIFFAVTSFTGCGGKDNMVVVRGKVTFDGKLVTEGRVRFQPEQGTTGRVSIVPIDENGEYNAHHKGGVPIGTHRISIVAYSLEGIGPALDGNDPSIDMANPRASIKNYRKKLPIPVYEIEGLPQFLPSKYNVQSELTVEVTGEENPQTQDFELNSKGS